MTFAQAIRSGFRNYVGFTGRATRSEFWWWVLFQILALVVASVADSLLHTQRVFYALAALGLFLPGLALQIRRLHDTDRSGWWVFISLIPIVGAILIIVWWCLKGSVGANKYGVDTLLAGGIDASVFSPVAGPGDMSRQG